jgi:alpha-glucan phosphorylase-like protein
MDGQTIGIHTDEKIGQGFSKLNQVIAKSCFEDSIEDVAEFYAAIERQNLTHKISDGRPYVYTTMEIYDAENGIRGAGGLGILAADTRRIAQMLDIPFVTLTPFYPTERHQKMENLTPIDYETTKNPADFDFQKVGTVPIRVAQGSDANLEIWEKILGSTRFLTMTEPGFGKLYAGDGSGDHRLYQLVSLGFGGYAALKMKKLKPAVIQLNETSTIFAAVARLDELCKNGMNLYEAIVYVRKHTLYTNHTLVQAAESEFSREQFEQFVYPNVTSLAVKHYILGLFKGHDRLKLSSLTIELAEAKNGVSKLHARVANYHDLSGERVEFRAITNGIDLPTWVDPAILKFYRERQITNKFDMPSEHFREELSRFSGDDIAFLKQLKRLGRARLNQVLATRKNQFGQPVQIPTDATLFEFKRRFVEYKRPWMPFEDLNRLKKILRDNNAYYLMTGMMAGNVAAGDPTYDHLQRMLTDIAGDDFLRERVHYITDYDENLAAAMAIGSDISINVPVVGLEACGTSFMKDIANLTLLISTNDGGVADVEPPEIFMVNGSDYTEEVESLYVQMESAASTMHDSLQWYRAINRQLSAYLPIICGARMMRDSLRFLFRTT